MRTNQHAFSALFQLQRGRSCRGPVLWTLIFLLGCWVFVWLGAAFCCDLWRLSSKGQCNWYEEISHSTQANTQLVVIIQLLPYLSLSCECDLDLLTFAPQVIPWRLANPVTHCKTINHNYLIGITLQNEEQKHQICQNTNIINHLLKCAQFLVHLYNHYHQHWREQLRTEDQFWYRYFVGLASQMSRFGQSCLVH